MIITSDFGLTVGRLVKFITFVISFLISLHFLNTWREKKHPIPRNMTIAFIFYSLAPLFSLADTFLNWKDIIRENTLLGMALAFIASSVGNTIFYWFVSSIFSTSNTTMEHQKRNLIIVIITQIGATTLGLIFRLIGLNAFIFSIIYMVSGLYVFLLLFIRARKLSIKIEEPEYKRKLVFMSNSSLFMLLSLILFAIDSFFDFPTWYSLTGWIMTIIASNYIRISY